MSETDDLLSESAEDLYENAPCGYLTMRLNGAIVKVNRTFESMSGFSREELVGARRFQDLLAPGSRIYHETHFLPLLQMQGSIREIAVELVRADGSPLPALVNSVLRGDAGRSQLVRMTVFDASDRRRYERELVKARKDQQEIALELQRGLLSKALPDVDGLDLDVAYRPGRSGTDVGGDWYDVFCTGENETVVLVVGDIVGRGIKAAAEMGQLRSAVRAFAATGLGPAGVLDALDQFSERHGVGQLATLFYAELERQTRCLRYASAGHLPPLTLRADRSPSLISDGRSHPLATPMMPAGGAREQAMLELEAGDTLVLYTDGLVERRDRGFETGMEMLMSESAKHATETPGVLAGALIRALHDASDSDDVCVLVARVSG